MSSVKYAKAIFVAATILLAVLIPAVNSTAQDREPQLLKEMKWRSIGPANFSGRIVDVEALDTDFTNVVVASASGGIWKSTNAGTTWEPIFDEYASASIGDIAQFQRDPETIWVGTGEANNRNSVAWGDGVYKSTDGGKTFINMGLRETYQIARIVTHPEDPDTVYVAAIGNLWVSHVEASHHAEGTCYVTFDGHRSDHYQAWVFKTTDYGENWTNITNNIPAREVMYVIRADPKNPHLLFAGSEFSCFVSLDGGRSWDRFMNNMPTVAFHDLAIHPRDGDLIAGTHGRSLWIADDITPLQQFTEEVRSSEAYLFEQRPVTIWEDASRGGRDAAGHTGIQR